MQAAPLDCTVFGIMCRHLTRLVMLQIQMVKQPAPLPWQPSTPTLCGLATRQMP